MSLPDESRVEKLFHDLSNTDETFSQLKASVGALEQVIKITEAKGILEADGSMEIRRATARASDEYERAVEDWENAKADFTLLEAQRNRAYAEIEVWRSLNASRRKS